MTRWRPQTFKATALAKGASATIVQNVFDTGLFLQSKTPDAQPIFSLRHLAHLVDMPYTDLRRVVSRHTPEPYRVFRIRKRPLPGEEARFRTIVVPDPWLMELQRWINANILQYSPPHHASVAFTKGDSIRGAASIHCGCRWLVKIDIKNFFESITEKQVCKVFKNIGYQPLVAFELARLCTRVGNQRTRQDHKRFQTPTNSSSVIEAYHKSVMGHLPQGAPTSPRIANLVAHELDTALSSVAQQHSLTYTRYADDLIFSTTADIDRATVQNFISEVYKTIASSGFTPNALKTVVSPPGSRKVVLGLLIDRDTPRLSREFKAKLRQHLYYLRKDDSGPLHHSSRQGGATILGLRRHVFGLIQHACQIEECYGSARLREFNQVHW